MFQCFDHTVFRIHDRPESFSRMFNALMVRRVGCTLGAINPVHKGFLFDKRPVQVVFFRRETHMLFSERKMLYQSPAESDVQQLMASADAEHGTARCQKLIQRFKLKSIQVVIDRFLRNPTFPVTGGIDVHAARQQNGGKNSGLRAAGKRRKGVEKVYNRRVCPHVRPQGTGSRGLPEPGGTKWNSIPRTE